QANYWTPKPVIPYVIGRGCYWGRCSFCDIPIGYDYSISRMSEILLKHPVIRGDTHSSRRKRSFDRVIGDLAYLSKTHGTTYFSFGDEELDSELLKAFSRELSDNGLSLDFECYSRIEPIYADNGQDFCRKLRDSGCRFLQFGLESVSGKVLMRNRKLPETYTQSDLGQIFRNTYEAGIMNHAFILVGLPGDSLIEASRLVPFLEQYAKYLTTIKPIHHKVSKWSPIALDPRSYNLILDQKTTGDLEANIHVSEHSPGMSRKKAEAFVRFLDLWIRKYHRVNVATSQYIYAQRLFLTREELDDMSARFEQSSTIDSHDDRYLHKVYSGLVEEFRRRSEPTSEETVEKRQAFAELYSQFASRSPRDFADVLAIVHAAAASR
ncbi:radical SAM protein, partial [Candidatus Bipolaricaulota bacterium]